MEEKNKKKKPVILEVNYHRTNDYADGSLVNTNDLNIEYGNGSTLVSGSIVWEHNAGGTPVYASEEVKVDQKMARYIHTGDWVINEDDKQMIFYADDGTTYFTIDTTGTATTLTAGDSNTLNLVPSDSNLSTIVGNLTIRNGATAASNENW